jgi:hypothetical protein
MLGIVVWTSLEQYRECKMRMARPRFDHTVAATNAEAASPWRCLWRLQS